MFFLIENPSFTRFNLLRIQEGTNIQISKRRSNKTASISYRGYFIPIITTTTEITTCLLQQ